MRRLCFCFSALLSAAVLLAQPLSMNAQSALGDVARQNRRTPVPKQKKVITNDDLQPREMRAEKNDPKSDGDGSAPAPKLAESAPKKADAGAVQSQAELLAAWKGRIAGKKQEIELLQRESAVAEREAQMQQRDYYMDAGERLRNPRAFTEKQEKAKAEIESKRASLDSAKQQLSDMIEQARKEGIPASQLE